MPAPLIGIHHIALICSDYIRAKHFYTQVLGARILAEHYRAERHSHKLDLCLPDGKQLELFSFPNPPPRRSISTSGIVTPRSAMNIFTTRGFGPTEL